MFCRTSSVLCIVVCVCWYTYQLKYSSKTQTDRLSTQSSGLLFETACGRFCNVFQHPILSWSTRHIQATTSNLHSSIVDNLIVLLRLPVDPCVGDVPRHGHGFSLEDDSPTAWFLRPTVFVLWGHRAVDRVKALYLHSPRLYAVSNGQKTRENIPTKYLYRSAHACLCFPDTKVLHKNKSHKCLS